MPQANLPAVRHSLAEIRPHETVQIQTILFDTLKELCSGLGVGEGDVLCCLRTSASVLLLQTAAGRKVLVETDWARFIAVTQPTESLVCA